MATHRFAPGQTVRFSPSRGEDSSGRGIYTVVTRLPEADYVLQYRIKAKTDGRSCVVREDQSERA
jgi:hypothetical protein